ncbi:hypothetical protein, partial [Hydrogenimonas sp.]
GLITRRSEVQILLPQPIKPPKQKYLLEFFLFCTHSTEKTQKSFCSFLLDAIFVKKNFVSQSKPGISITPIDITNELVQLFILFIEYSFFGKEYLVIFGHFKDRFNEAGLE